MLIWAFSNLLLAPIQYLNSITNVFFFGMEQVFYQCCWLEQRFRAAWPAVCLARQFSSFTTSLQHKFNGRQRCVNVGHFHVFIYTFIC
jgi:hypothetical protein